MNRKRTNLSAIVLIWIKILIFCLAWILISCGKNSFSDKMDSVDDDGRQSSIQVSFPPNDYTAYSESLFVNGIAHDIGGISKIEILVNEQIFWSGAGPNWSRDIPLQIGENKIIAKMTNSKGNVSRTHPVYVYRLWKKSGELPSPVAYQSVVTDGTDFYLIGGWTFYWDFLPADDYFWRFHPGNAQITQYALSHPHYSSASVFYSDKIFIIGGLKKKSFGNLWQDQAKNNNIDSYGVNGFPAAPSGVLPYYAVIGASAYGVINAKVYLAGGIDPDGSAVDSILEYDLISGDWKIKKTLGKKLKFAGSAVYQDKLYIFGGMDENNKYQNTVYIYDPAVDDWILFEGRLGFERAGMGCVRIGNKVYLMGGEGIQNNGQPGFFDTVEVFNLDTQTSYELRKMPEKIAYMAASTDGEKIFLFGGKTGDEFPSISRIYEYYPLLDNLNP